MTQNVLQSVYGIKLCDSCYKDEETADIAKCEESFSQIARVKGEGLIAFLEI